MKKIITKLTAIIVVTILLLGLSVPILAVDDTDVQAVISMLESIDTLQQMQDNRDLYAFEANQYHCDVLYQPVARLTKHMTQRNTYESYLTNMFASRAAALQAYNSLTAEQQAQIDPALVAKLDNNLDTVFHTPTLSVTPRDDEYVFENPLGFGPMSYEVSTYMVARQIPQTFILVNTMDGKTEWTPNGRYEQGKSNYEALYCCDIGRGIEWNVDYRRINLEDSTYFSEESARHIRSIVLNSYPYITLDEMKANLKADGLNPDFVDSLTRSDIISAVQMAIWNYNYDGDFNYVNHGYFASISITKNSGMEGPYFHALHDFTNEIWEWLPPTMTRSYDSRAEYRVNNLIQYLNTLESEPPAENCIAISEIQVGRLDLVPQAKDVYNVGLHVILNEGCTPEDNVTLNITSYSEDQNGNRMVTDSRNVKLDAKKEYALSVNAKYGDTIEVKATGTQQLDRGVYFFEAEGGPDISQSLVGVSEGENPVYAVQRFTFEEDIEMGLRIYKKSTTTKAPISDITFDVYKVDPEENEVLNEVPTADEIAKYGIPENLVGSITTDITGYAALELTEKGTYLVIEQHNKEKVTEPAAPFYIVLPWPVEKEVEGPNGTETVIEYLDIVSTYPKNTPVTPPPPPPPPPPEKTFGSFLVYKHDSADKSNLLSNAKFQVYRAATESDTQTETLIYNGASCSVVPVTQDGLPLILITDENGVAVSPTLPCGVYYIKETQAPLGYILPKNNNVTSVTVVPDIYTEKAYVYVSNERGIELPETGGIGKDVFLISGALLSLVSIAFYVTGKRLRREV